MYGLDQSLHVSAGEEDVGAGSRVVTRARDVRERLALVLQHEGTGQRLF